MKTTLVLLPHAIQPTVVPLCDARLFFSQPMTLLNVTIGMLAAWKNLLYHVQNNMADLDGTPYATISKVALIDRQIKRLTKNLQGINTILSQVSHLIKLSCFHSLFMKTVTSVMKTELKTNSLSATGKFRQVIAQTVLGLKGMWHFKLLKSTFLSTPQHRDPN